MISVFDVFEMLRLRVPEGTNFDFKLMFPQLKSTCPGLVVVQALGKDSVVDLCFKTKEDATRAAARGVKFQNVYLELKSLAPTSMFVSYFLAIQFGDQALQNLLRFYREVKSMRRL